MDPISIGFRTCTSRSAPSCFRTIASRSSARVTRLTLAAEGKKVAVVSGGDPGVFAMAAAVFEAIEAGDPAWRELDIRVEPGITAMLAAAAEVGAPLGADFCAISLSDNLKSWETIERRLRAAAKAISSSRSTTPLPRPGRISSGSAFDLLRAIKVAADHRAVRQKRGDARNTRRHRQRWLKPIQPLADMRTLVIIGAAATRLISRDGAAALGLYAARGTGDGR